MIGKSKLVLALLGIALLVVNPAGVCAGTPSAHAPSHPCCPAPPTQHHGNGTGTCVCIDRQPTPPALPSLDSGHVTAAETDTSAALIASGSETTPVVDRAHFTREARFLTFHQILV
ncbi:MAG TPA: hypothetical protein VKB88_29660 [Bryobacteraceae bacterium]|nr:hypothetical protein [Bryobacteraceae bacterium]